MDLAEQFTAEMKMIDGKLIPVIKARAEEIRHPDGRVDVIIHAPCLSLMQKLDRENK